MRKIMIRALLLGATMGLVACTGPYLQLLATHGFTVDGDLDRARTTRAAQGTFNENLRIKYLALAELERVEYDWLYAAYFARKADEAGHGRLVLPALPEGDVFTVPRATLPDLNQARAELMAALDGGARDTFPDLASTAQTMYDCWVEEQDENHELDEIAACRKGFEDAMAAMRQQPAPVAVEPPARDYMVFFDFDKSAVRDDAALILDKVITADRGLNAKSVALVGYTDLAGPLKYNQKLSERRAAAVKAWLVRHGLPATTISTVGKGESDPRVKTPIGVREQENRRVEIHID